MDVIKKLNKLRLERNMSVYRLAELSGINQSTLANTFSRGTIPSIKHLELLCDTLGITLAQFFTEDEVPVTLSPQETKLIYNYRRLPDNIKTSISTIVNDIPNLQNWITKLQITAHGAEVPWAFLTKNLWQNTNLFL